MRLREEQAARYIIELASHFLAPDDTILAEAPILSDRTAIWTLALLGLVAACYAIAVWYPSVS